MAGFKKQGQPKGWLGWPPTTPLSMTWNFSSLGFRLYWMRMTWHNVETQTYLEIFDFIKEQIWCAWFGLYKLVPMPLWEGWGHALLESLETNSPLRSFEIKIFIFTTFYGLQLFLCSRFSHALTLNFAFVSKSLGFWSQQAGNRLSPIYWQLIHEKFRKSFTSNF